MWALRIRKQISPPIATLGQTPNSHNLPALSHVSRACKRSLAQDYINGGSRAVFNSDLRYPHCTCCIHCHCHSLSFTVIHCHSRSVHHCTRLHSSVCVCVCVCVWTGRTECLPTLRTHTHTHTAIGRPCTSRPCLQTVQCAEKESRERV